MMERHANKLFSVFIVTGLTTLLSACGGSEGSASNRDELGKVSSETATTLLSTSRNQTTASAFPPVPCADLWPDLIVSGLNEGDQVEVSWNPGWQGELVGSVGNGTIENRAFSYCGPQGERPALSFQLVNASGYNCDIDESEPLSRVVVECAQDVPEPPLLCGDNWVTLSVSGLHGSDEIEFVWNPDWIGGFSGKTGNGEINNRHFSYCGTVDDRPEFLFEITNSVGYDCDVDNSDPVTLISVVCESVSPVVDITPVLCGDSWPILKVSGLADGDEIEYSWNLGWQGGHTARVGNGEKSGFHFSFCGPMGEFPPTHFDVIDTAGYACSIDDSTPASHVLVECAPLALP